MVRRSVGTSVWAVRSCGPLLLNLGVLRHPAVLPTMQVVQQQRASQISGR